ncbi:hypothetical protein SDC9_183707 [bioreactor metagenome]|uniref:Uncharacterized protein n=1 Tax=bioreactor metagenome TaxID=1076179 RepID=A0A645HDJ9_9ZZZZ
MGCFLHEAQKLGHQSASGKGNVAGADIHTLGCRDDLQKFNYVIVIVQRLTAAHENDVGYGPGFFRAVGFVRLRTGDEGKHLAGQQVTHTALQGRRTKSAAHSAANLGGDAQGIAVVVTHKNAFHQIFIFQFKEVFNGCILSGNPFVINPCAAIGQHAQPFSQCLG